MLKACHASLLSTCNLFLFTFYPILPFHVQNITKQLKTTMNQNKFLIKKLSFKKSTNVPTSYYSIPKNSNNPKLFNIYSANIPMISPSPIRPPSKTAPPLPFHAHASRRLLRKVRLAAPVPRFEVPNLQWHHFAPFLLREKKRLR